jgi:hypothetical protein
VLASLDQDLEQKNVQESEHGCAADRLCRPSFVAGDDRRAAQAANANKDWGLDVVVNTPFTIVKGHDNQFYLYGGKHWYTAQEATGPYSQAGNIPSELQQVQTAVDNANSSSAGYTDSAAVAQDNVVSDIVVSTSPAELIQTTDSRALRRYRGRVFLMSAIHQRYFPGSGR